jgi:hypothetical protein
VFNKKSAKFWVSSILVVSLVFVIVFGCSNERQGITNPKNIVAESEDISVGQLHNEVMKKYLIIAYKEKLFQNYGEEGWRIPWEDAKRAMHTALNEVMQKYGLPTFTEMDVEEAMAPVVECAREGIMDLFHQETISSQGMMKAAEAGYIDEESAIDLSKAFNMIKEQDPQRPFQRSIALAKLQEENSSVDIMVHSIAFWEEVQGGKDFLREDKKDKEEDDEDGGSVWDGVKDWWEKHKQQVREVYIGTCDALGGAIGAGLGLGGLVAGAALGTAAGTIAWPPY